MKMIFSFLFAVSVFAQFTTIPSGLGTVGGASDLTTVGAIPYVSAAGTLNQDATRLFWDAPNDRLGVGTNTPTNTLHVKSTFDSAMVFGYTGIGANTRLSLANTAAVTTVRLDTDSFSYLGIASGANLGIGTTTDSNFKLDVAASGSAGTMRVYDATATTGVTKEVVRSGAGQSTTNLVEWQDSSGAITGQFKPSDYRFTIGVLTGGTYQSSFRAIDFEAWYGTQSPFTGPISQRSMLIGGNAAGLRVASDYGMYWSANAAGSGDAYGSLDAGLARRSAGLLQVNSGTSIGTTPGNARDVMLRGVYAAETTSDPSAAELSIAGSNAQDTFRLYMKNDKLVVAYNRSGTVNYLTIPLDGATTTWTQSTTAP